MTSAPQRVLVGVTGSLTNLEALRQAERTARENGAELFAVHVWDTGPGLEPPMSTAHKPGVIACVQRVEQAFDEALGGQPDDIDVHVVVLEGEPRVRLARLGRRDGDLLVVGSSLRPWWRPRLAASVPVHCVRHARCPVLVVPPAGLARRAAARPLAGLAGFPTRSRTGS